MMIIMCVMGVCCHNNWKQQACLFLVITDFSVCLLL